MTEKQELKTQLLKEFANNDKPESIEFCRKAYEFLAESDTTPQVGAVVANQEPAGIYLVFDGGRHVLFTGNNNADDCAACIGIGVKWGNKSIMVALNDQADGEDITLTSQTSDKDHGGYKDSYMDAVQDWQGKHNTELLKRIGLNPDIQLKDGEYIPTLAELYLICLNQRAINAAMRFVGGQELAGGYWSSTEYSAAFAWILYLDTGGAYYYPKATSTIRVRAVSAFIS